ncbi:tRNA1(Val) (adenine(37)-N6)-methyltransferase [Ostreiculturibacter nitratireducens]|uniref:tRNA1(Val) (adenine(37)-N6)-methyltransferase n=1 Tax=Ostreiculturibacter nitratireducens TaxID=3075226 RepID=UPI0031B5A3F8
MFSAEDLTEDGFLGGRLRILQPRRGYRAATDPVLLAAAVIARQGDSVLELGCGAGVASLCLAARVPGLTLAGLEVQPSYADLARRNAALNGFAFEVVEGDLSRMPAALRARSFDHVIANPPFFPPASGTTAADAGRERAQREATPLADWIDAALKRLTPGGRITLIQRTERLPEILALLSGRAGDVAALPVAAREGREAGRVIVIARKGAKGPFRLAAPFILHAGATHISDGDDYTEAARVVLRTGATLGF